MGVFIYRQTGNAASREAAVAREKAEKATVLVRRVARCYGLLGFFGSYTCSSISRVTINEHLRYDICCTTNVHIKDADQC